MDSREYAAALELSEHLATITQRPWSAKPYLHALSNSDGLVEILESLKSQGALSGYYNVGSDNNKVVESKPIVVEKPYTGIISQLAAQVGGDINRYKEAAKWVSYLLDIAPVYYSVDLRKAAFSQFSMVISNLNETSILKLRGLQDKGFIKLLRTEENKTRFELINPKQLTEFLKKDTVAIFGELKRERAAKETAQFLEDDAKEAAMFLRQITGHQFNAHDIGADACVFLRDPGARIVIQSIQLLKVSGVFRDLQIENSHVPGCGEYCFLYLYDFELAGLKRAAELSLKNPDGWMRDVKKDQDPRHEMRI